MSSLTLVRRLVSGTVTAVRQANGSHLHRMDGYSLLQQAMKPGSAVTSSVFAVGGRKWELLLYPNGISADHHSGFVSADLRLAREDKGTREATASYRVSVLDHAGNPAHSAAVGPARFRGSSYVDLDSSSSSWTEKRAAAEELRRMTRVEELVAAEELRRAAPFLLRDDRLDVRCDVSVVETDSTRRSRWFMGLRRVFRGYSY